MNIEQLKTDESLWPDGATHCISGEFTMWVDGVEFDYIAGEWVESEFKNTLDHYSNHLAYTVIERPKTNAIVKTIIDNDALLDAHTTIGVLIQALKFYTDGSIYQQKADGQFTIAQEDEGQLAQEALKRAEEALADIEEYIDIQAGRIAHG